VLSPLLRRAGASQVLVAASFLVASGLVMVYSASAVRAELRFGSSSTYLFRQLGALALGLPLAFLALRAPPEWLRRLAYPGWTIAFALLLLTFSPLGQEQNGARRWLALGPFGLQPLELTKLGVVLALARWLSDQESRLADARVSILVPALFVGLPAVALLFQPDFHGALLLATFGGLLIYAAGGRLDHLLLTAALAVPVALAAALARSYRAARLQTFLDPWADPSGHGYQIVQSLLAFGAGGVTGTALGAGQQKLGFLPEAHTDFLLSVVAEETGLVGVAAVLAAFMALALGSLGIALRAGSTFGMLLALGAGLLLWLQGALNAGVAMGALPTTGATLPLFSYGRSSLVVSLIAVGLCLNVARPRRGRGGWRL
jgi:cell division protein FtsW